MNSAVARIEQSIIRIPWSGCWIWMKARQKRGYGNLFVNGVCMLAHRFVYQTLVGQVPDGLFVLHRCDIPECVNPNHLYVGTDRQNLIDQYERQRREFKMLPAVQMEMVKLLCQGKRNHEIADALGITKFIVCRWKPRLMRMIAQEQYSELLEQRNALQRKNADLVARLAQAEQEMTVSDSMVDAYCLAWICSFEKANPYHSDVECTAEDREHIRVALIAALNAQGREGR